MIRDDLPGAELVTKGLSDLSAGLPTIEALLVLIGAPRLRRAGVAVPESAILDPEMALYEILENEDRRTAHSRYNALLRRLVSFERAIECVA